MRNSIPSMVLPQPGPPQTIVVRPRGNPPPLISSSPLIPVGAFGNEFSLGSPFRGISSSITFERFATILLNSIQTDALYWSGFHPAQVLVAVCCQTVQQVTYSRIMRLGYIT